MGIQDILHRMREKREERNFHLKNLEQQRNAEKTLDERGKSANERELIKIIEKKRENVIKDRLEIEHKINNPTLAPNIFRDTVNPFKHERIW